VALVLMASCAPLFGDAPIVSVPFPHSGQRGGSAELKLHVPYGATYAFYLELGCRYPECGPMTLFETLKAKAGDPRLLEKYGGIKIIPAPLHIVVTRTDSEPAKIVQDKKSSDFNITMLGGGYFDVFVGWMNFPHGDYTISIEFLQDVPEIAKHPALFTVLLPHRG
jgi:hypothetical protein